MADDSFQNNFIQEVQATTPPVASPIVPPKDRTKLALIIIAIILSCIILIESFVLAVVVSNYYGVFEPEYYDEEVNYDDYPEFYEENTEK